MSKRPFTVAAHEAARGKILAALLATVGKSPAEIIATIAAGAVDALREKGKPRA